LDAASDSPVCDCDQAQSEFTFKLPKKALDCNSKGYQTWDKKKERFGPDFHDNIYSQPSDWNNRVCIVKQRFQNVTEGLRKLSNVLFRLDLQGPEGRDHFVHFRGEKYSKSNKSCPSY